ncbi:MAG: D-cysteine desulfhydrase family protein [Zestosphaera sp.]
MIGRILSFPRFRLTSLPTPMEEAPKLGRKLGVELWVKRDDVMELVMGGNKVRKLEFILAHALSCGRDVLVTMGAYHSNHARLTVAAARRAGLDAYVVLYRHLPDIPPEMQGNILLERLLDGKIVYAESAKEAEELMGKVARDLEAEGRRPYVIPAGGASEYGVLGYALAALEIVQQSLERGFRPDYIVHASGTAATQAGLVLGLKLLGMDDVRVIGISSGRRASVIAEHGVELVRSAGRLLNVDLHISADDFTVYDQYTFGGYGVITREVVETMRTVGSLEGLLLDPVYTAKGMYGLMDLVNRGEIKGKVVFIHTGGTPIVFQYADVVSAFM